VLASLHLEQRHPVARVAAAAAAVPQAYMLLLPLTPVACSSARQATEEVQQLTLS
jgi:hypothetical protein